jgi:heat shock protein HtpX
MDEIIRLNRMRVYIYMTLIMIILGILGTLLSSAFNWGLTGTGVFLIVGGLVNIVAYFFSDRLIIRAAKAKQLKREQAPELFLIVEELASVGQIPVPKIYLLDDPSMNAFATGRSPQHAAIAVTRGLLEKLNVEEVKGVVAHELAHIRNWDTLLMTAVAVLAGLISIAADIYWRSRIISKASDRDRSGITAYISLALAVFAPLTAMLIQLAISRQREFLADATGAKFARNTAGLAASLEKISRDRRPLPHMSHATAHICFSNPLQEGGLLDKLFSTHPPIPDRIQKLNQLNLGL